MKKIFIIALFIISINSIVIPQNKFKLVKIKYLSADILEEKIMLTYIGFKEGAYYSEKELDALIGLARLRLKFYGVFGRANIFYSSSEENPDEKICFIELTEGNRTSFLAQSYYGMLAKKNWLHRGDLLQGYFGLNRNIFKTLNNMKFGWMYFEQETGWIWKMKNHYFPFFPLYGDEDYYIHNAFTLGSLGFKPHPDIKFGLQTGASVHFLNEIKNREFINDTNYSFSYQRLGFPVYAFFEADQRYLRDKYYFGYRFYFSGGANIDAFNLTTFFPLNTELSLYVKPNNYVTIIAKERLYNLLGSPPAILKFDVNYSDVQRGRVLSNYRGDFLFINNIDCIVAFYHIKFKVTTVSLGASFLYDGILIGDNATILNEINYYNTIGTGFWVRMAEPINISVFINFGYTIFHSWAISVILVAGEW